MTQLLVWRVPALATLKCSVLMLVGILLSACSHQPEKSVVSMEDELEGKTIANIRPVGVRLVNLPAPPMDTPEAIRRYQRYLELAPQNDTRVHVMHRLADLKLMSTEDLLSDNPEALDSQKTQAVYQEAIDTYKKVLAQFPNRRDSDMLLYQLAKAHVMKGDEGAARQTLERLTKTFPASELVNEAYYRLGDLYFNSELYRLAELAFASAMEKNTTGRFYTSANYMRGWAQFKQRSYQAALESFISVIDSRFSDTTAIVHANKGDRELLQDTIRAMSMIFSEDGGQQKVASLFNKVGRRHFEYLIYDGLGRYYLDKQQYSDAANTFLAFVKTNPTDVSAPTFYAHIVKSYRKAGYAELVLKHKMAFIERYGVHSEYWQRFGDDIHEMIRPNLKGYTAELAQYHHSKGQKSKDLTVRFNHLLAASRWYQEYIDTFSADSNIGEMYFLKAEALYEIARYEEALLDYEKGGFEFVDHNKAEESAFAALVTYNQLIQRHHSEDVKHAWLSKKVDSALLFATRYPHSTHTTQVLARAAEGLFTLSRFTVAAETSKRVLASKDATLKQKSVAHLIMGHSYFDLHKFDEAEKSYIAAIQLNLISPQEITNVREKLAASIYKQGVYWISQNKFDRAIDEFMRVGKVVPESPIRISAHYDAAAYLMQKENWGRAESILLSFREAFPQHKLTLDIPSKLIVVYEGLEEWRKAAFELQEIWRTSKDKEKQRVALFQSAEYYEKDGDIENAMAMLKRYAHNYPKPFNTQLESIDRLEALYLKQNKHEKRKFWLAKLILADRQSGTARTARSKYLAAKASFSLADYERQSYASIPLTLPLKNSLAKKKVALKRTLDAYQQTAKMEVQEFTTAATYQIAEIYGELSRDLMNSQRPAGLNELELEEYDYLLEDQAFPFEEAAIKIHETNVKRSWDGLYDDWISKSLVALGKLMPARYGKEEVRYDVIAEIH